MELRVKTKFRGSERAAQQIIGREGETATFLSRRPSNSTGLGGGFAPRQFNRYVFRVGCD